MRLRRDRSRDDQQALLFGLFLKQRISAHRLKGNQILITWKGCCRACGAVLYAIASTSIFDRFTRPNLDMV